MCSMPDPPPARRSDDTHVIANTLSPQGRKVELTERKWAYVQHHVEMRGELELLLATVQFEGDVDHVVTAFGQDNEPEGLPT
jgi:hypothetical protein